MSWRFVALTGLLIAFSGSAAVVKAQDESGSTKAAASSKAAGAAEQAPVAGDAAPDAAARTPAKAASAKAKTSSAAKAKSRKSGVRQKADSLATSSTSPPKYELATFGAGCFWHVEADFERLNGVVSAVSGYAGGDIKNPNYEMVHEGFTGHAEVVMVQYDPEIISYEDLLKAFWQCHDPTTPNRQGPDVGTQYRSIILYHSDAQKKAALKSYDQLVAARAFRNPIVTQLVPMKVFYRAEDEHQDYYGGKPRASSRRRTTAASKSRRPQSKVAKALAASPAGEAADSTDAAKPGETSKPTGDSASSAKDTDPKP